MLVLCQNPDLVLLLEECIHSGQFEGVLMIVLYYPLLIEQDCHALDFS